MIFSKTRVYTYLGILFHYSSFFVDLIFSDHKISVAQLVLPAKTHVLFAHQNIAFLLNKGMVHLHDKVPNF
jgi:hypothetical protein